MIYEIDTILLYPCSKVHYLLHKTCWFVCHAHRRNTKDNQSVKTHHYQLAMLRRVAFLHILRHIGFVALFWIIRLGWNPRGLSFAVSEPIRISSFYSSSFHSRWLRHPSINIRNPIINAWSSSLRAQQFTLAYKLTSFSNLHFTLLRR